MWPPPSLPPSRGKWPKASRMRRAFKEQASLEEYRRAGAFPRRRIEMASVGAAHWAARLPWVRMPVGRGPPDAPFRSLIKRHRGHPQALPLPEGRCLFKDQTDEGARPDRGLSPGRSELFYRNVILEKWRRHENFSKNRGGRPAHGADDRRRHWNRPVAGRPGGRRAAPLVGIWTPLCPPAPT